MDTDLYTSALLYKADPRAVIADIGIDLALEMLDQMLLIRHFEARGEQSYQQGKVWGFYHAYTGQEGVQTAITHALGKEKNLYAATYRCHALALLLGMTPEQGMAELFGKVTGNAGGRGGSMHMYTKNMFGGSGIVGGQWPLGAGLAFSLKYRNIKDEVAVVFGGDGSTPQGTFHESLNLAQLWKLPCIFVVENNMISMGTQIERTTSCIPIAENMSKAYGMKSYTVDGINLTDVYDLFKKIKKEVLETSKPVLVEVLCQRFKGHSISDAATYRSKEEVEEMKKKDPIDAFKKLLKENCGFTDEEFEKRSEIQKAMVIKAVQAAEKADFPSIDTLEEGVMVD
ncbi:MAG: Acetoin:2,6-dichlorophenolindophenol oxidoreductase subunit alpha [Chlamydiia bacterium]|nr:Acetoin:2,6-dichlorophenolindophenol oxidoreductase subunit alpha [Chlamydiia bacterium]MCH9617992.1 Acetoin:2,6-dichlorophenolindophenol oxidoreductase subunit alpha [Chlamydiia bacterium]MCH9623683.1 Acetoin:2,6-dichlorophenolindophenol oxidoreductase subunit alpha [Chlamydiia bacterium]